VSSRQSVPAPRPAPRSASPALPPQLAQLNAACGAQRGRLIDLDNGRLITLEVHRPLMEDVFLEATLEDGTRLKGAFEEVRWVGQAGDAPFPKRKHGENRDTLYYGSGFLKRDSLVIDFEYWRHDGGGAVGKATDNRGRRYKLLL
jgi:hypothetical protein